MGQARWAATPLQARRMLSWTSRTRKMGTHCMSENYGPRRFRMLRRMYSHIALLALHSHPTFKVLTQ